MTRCSLAICKNLVTGTNCQRIVVFLCAVYNWKQEHVLRWLKQLSPQFFDLYSSCFSEHCVTGGFLTPKFMIYLFNWWCVSCILQAIRCCISIRASYKRWASIARTIGTRTGRECRKRKFEGWAGVGVPL